jgi:hypothetical protein
MLAAAVLGAVAIAVAVSSRGGEPEVHRYAPAGAGYSFDVPPGFKLVYVKEASAPEGTPASGHRRKDGMIISAWWDGINAARGLVTLATVPAATSRLSAIVRSEEAENRDRVLRRMKSYSGFVHGPTSVALAGRPGLRFVILRTESSGRRVHSDSYAAFKGRTPFRLECIWPLGVPDREARSACRTVTRSLRLGTSPITG